MTCPICSYEWCWTCGLRRKHIFHRIQRLKGETGYVCEIVNGISQKMACLPYPIALMVSILVLLVWPVVLIIPGVIAGIPSLFVSSFYLIKKIDKYWERIMTAVMCFIFVWPLMVLIAAAYSLFLAFYYLVVPVLIVIMLLRIIYYHCFKPQSSNKNS